MASCIVIPEARGVKGVAKDANLINLVNGLVLVLWETAQALTMNVSFGPIVFITLPPKNPEMVKMP